MFLYIGSYMIKYSCDSPLIGTLAKVGNFSYNNKMYNRQKIIKKLGKMKKRQDISRIIKIKKPTESSLITVLTM